MRRLHWLIVVAFVAIVGAAPARAVDSYDVLYVDRVDVSFTGDEAGYGIFYGFAILANTGMVSITSSELQSATFTAVPSVAGARLTVLNGNLADFAPIGPGQAVGDVTSRVSVLLGQLRSGEVFENTAPSQVLSYDLGLPWRGFEGTVTFQVVARLGGREVGFPMRFDVHQGAASPSIRHVSAARVSSAGAPLAAATLTWGRLKRLYR
jgi:hypothetical protein